MVADDDVLHELRTAYATFDASVSSDQLLHRVGSARRRHKRHRTIGIAAVSVAAITAAAVGVLQLPFSGARDSLDRAAIEPAAPQGSPQQVLVGEFRFTAPSGMQPRPGSRLHVHPSWPTLTASEQQQVDQDQLVLQPPSDSRQSPAVTDDPSAQQLVLTVIQGPPRLLQQFTEGSQPEQRTERREVNGRPAVLHVISTSDEILELTWAPRPDTRVLLSSSALTTAALFDVARSASPAMG